MLTEEELNDGFNLGEWQILPTIGVIRRGDLEVRPEPQTWRVLLALAKRNGTLVTKEELVDEVWDGRAVTDDPINRAIREVRKSLGDSAHSPEFVETLHKRGYRLLVAIELHNAPAIENADMETNQTRWRIVAGAVAIGFAGVLWFSNIVDVSGPEPDVPVRSIAVMPFENLSGSEADEYLVLGFKEELVQILQGIQSYTVKNSKLSYAKEDAEIAQMLGVESLLFGTLRRSGDNLKINYRISTDGRVVGGGEVEGGVGNEFSLQESLAMLVRHDLIGKSSQTLITSRPSDSQAYESYMRGMYALQHRGSPENLEKAIELFENAIRLDEKYGPSYLALATVYPLLPTYRGAPTETMDRLALETIEKGIAADPMIEDAAGAIYGYVYHKQKRWEESEAAFLRATNADVVDSNAFNWYSRMLASVGRLDESLTQILAALEIDPSAGVVNSRTAMSYAWVGDTENALEYYERANDLGWEGQFDVLGYTLILLQTGEVEKARNLAMRAIQSTGDSTDWVDPVFDAFADPSASNKAVALDAFDAVSAAQPISPLIELTVRGMLGDLDGAMRVAELLEGPGEAFQMDMLFISELKDLRRHPDFMPLMDRLGITQYWQSKGCIWDGDQLDCEAD